MGEASGELPIEANVSTVTTSVFIIISLTLIFRDVFNFWFPDHFPAATVPWASYINFHSLTFESLVNGPSIEELDTFLMLCSLNSELGGGNAQVMHSYIYCICAPFNMELKCEEWHNR